MQRQFSKPPAAKCWPPNPCSSSRMAGRHGWKGTNLLHRPRHTADSLDTARRHSHADAYVLSLFSAHCPSRHCTTARARLCAWGVPPAYSTTAVYCTCNGCSSHFNVPPFPEQCGLSYEDWLRFLHFLLWAKPGRNRDTRQRWMLWAWQRTAVS
jgi:hypothetical protein